MTLLPTLFKNKIKFVPSYSMQYVLCTYMQIFINLFSPPQVLWKWTLIVITGNYSKYKYYKKDNDRIRGKFNGKYQTGFDKYFRILAYRISLMPYGP